MSACKMPVGFVSYFIENWSFSTDFREILKPQSYKNSCSDSRLVSSVRTDLNNEANVRFSQFYERNEKLTSAILLNVEKQIYNVACSQADTWIVWIDCRALRLTYKVPKTAQCTHS